MDKDNKIISLDNDKLNKATEENKTPAEDTKEENKEPALERREDGKIKVELYAIGKDDKGRYIVEDTFFDKYYKELPDGTGNKSKTFKAYNGGKIKCLTSEDAYIQRMGALASNAKQAQRRTFAEAIEQILTKKASVRAIEDLGLTEDADNMEMITAAALRQASKGNVKAMEFLRDTVGEKPTDKLEASVETMTAEDREMLANIQKRMEENG